MVLMYQRHVTSWTFRGIFGPNALIVGSVVGSNPEGKRLCRGLRTYEGSNKMTHQVERALMQHEYRKTNIVSDETFGNELKTPDQ